LLGRRALRPRTCPPIFPEFSHAQRPPTRTDFDCRTEAPDVITRLRFGALAARLSLS